MPNYRLYYAVEQLGFAPDGTTNFTALHGVQSCGITTTFNLQQFFELGQLEIYENKENTPDIQITAQKLLDGYTLLYHAATYGASSATLAGRSRARTSWALATFDDTKDSASGVPIAEVFMSGLFCNSFSYTFDVNNAFTEDITLVGNNKLWRNTESVVPLFSGAFANNDSPRASTGSGGVNIRQHFIWGDGTTAAAGYAAGTSRDSNGMVLGYNYSILPPDVDGISSSGTNNLNSTGARGASVQSISVSVDLNREELLELGRKTPYFRAVSFPIAVNCSISTLSKKWDNVSATEYGVQGSTGDNLLNRSIRLYTTEGTFLDLGVNNKLQSVDFNGGDTGGGNVTVTYNYQNFNKCTVVHPHDVTTALRTYP